MADKKTACGCGCIAVKPAEKKPAKADKGAKKSK